MLDLLGIGDPQSEPLAVAEVLRIPRMLVGLDAHALSFFYQKIVADHIQRKGIGGEKQPVVRIAELGGGSGAAVVLAAQPVIDIQNQLVPDDGKRMSTGGGCR